MMVKASMYMVTRSEMRVKEPWLKVPCNNHGQNDHMYNIYTKNVHL